MKRVFVVVLALLLTFSLIPLAAWAEAPISAEEYDGKTYVCWDNLFLDNTNTCLGSNGQVRDWLAKNDYTLTGTYSKLMFYGWASADQEILSVGYALDRGDVVWEDGAARAPEEGVVNAAAAFGCDYSVRFLISVDTEGMNGTHTLGAYMKLQDGTVILMESGNDVEFTYRAGNQESETPTPENTEPLNPEDCIPGVYFLFDEDEKYFLLFTEHHNMSDAGYNPTKGCEILHVEQGPDPNLTLDMAGLEDFFPEGVNLDVYKYLQFGLKIDPAIGREGYVYYDTEADAGIAEGKNISFRYEDTADFQAVTVSFAKAKKWKGSLSHIRFDAFESAAEETDVELYYVAFFATAEQAAAFPKIYTEKGNEAFRAPATATPEGTPEVTPEVTAEPEPTETVVPEATATAEPENTDEKKGCGGALVFGPIPALMLAAAAIVTKKKEKQ